VKLDGATLDRAHLRTLSLADLRRAGVQRMLAAEERTGIGRHVAEDPAFARVLRELDRREHLLHCEGTSC
jgi:hypothetical protein